MYKHICAMIGVAALVSVVFATCAVGAPSAEFMAAALHQHESRTLDVAYTTTVGDLVCKTRYVRTPEMLYREDTFYYPSGRVPAVTISRHSYNRSTCEFRTLSMVDNPKNVKNGRITQGLQDPFWQQDMLDPVRFPLPPYACGASDGTLGGFLSLGRVSEAQEAADGFSCWHVVVPGSKEGIVRYDVWLDENVGFSPRRIDFVWASGGPTIYHFRTYVQSGDLWLPQELVVDVAASSAIPAETLTCRVDSIRSGAEIPKGELEVQFPSGTPVSIGDSGEVVIIQP